MSFGDYEGAGELYYGGRLLAEITECSYRLESNNNDVDTMQKGFTGQSKGPRRVVISFTTAIPKAGYEVDFHAVLAGDRTVRFVFKDGDKRRTAEGKIQSHESSRSTGAVANTSYEFRGAPVGSR
jgi:hypothetical protein